MALIRINLFSESGFLVGIFINVYLGVKPSKYLEGFIRFEQKRFPSLMIID